MKIREDFVTNSSSTSYVILIKKEPEVCEHCGYKPHNILDVLVSNAGYDSGIEAEGKREILEVLDDNIRLDGEEYWKELRKTIKALPDDARVAWIQLGYHEELVNHVFETALARGDIEQLDPTT